MLEILEIVAMCQHNNDTCNSDLEAYLLACCPADNAVVGTQVPKVYKYQQGCSIKLEEDLWSSPLPIYIMDK